MITIEENETRYDADITSHGHFKRKTCGAVYDFSIANIQLNQDKLKDFEIEERHLYFKDKYENCL